jgi:hypothetical protein
MVKKLLLLTFLAAPFLAAGCSTSDDTTGATNCNQSSTVSATCQSGSTGYACDSGTTPDDDDPTFVCSAGVAADGSDNFCCFDSGFTTTGGSCAPDDGVTDSCAEGTYGFTCAPGDTDPSTQDPNLTACSAPAGTATADLYCCTYSATTPGGGGNPIPANCSADATVTTACGGTANGYSCDIGTTPEDDDPTRVCSQPTADGSSDDFCCYDSGFSTTGGSCTPDDSVSDACAEGTYGFSCAAGDTDPTTQDSALTSCSVPDTSTNADLYCCSYN